MNITFFCFFRKPGTAEVSLSCPVTGLVEVCVDTENAPIQFEEYVMHIPLFALHVVVFYQLFSHFRCNDVNEFMATVCLSGKDAA